jgi:small subunit ribosomal protein S2
MHDKDFNNISKRERLQVQRERAKLDKNLGSIADLTRLPSALFVIDINKEHIAVAEARRLNIPTFALVDTNTNPELIDFPIPANDDASKSIAAILKHMCEAIQEGLNERALDKDAQAEEEVEAVAENAEEKPVEKKTRARRPRNTEAKAEEAPKAE